MTKAVLSVLAALLLLAVRPAAAGSGGGFDYYVLSLSWSPSFCASAAGRRDPAECAAGRHYAFVVHGLWPQYEYGWPQYCDTSERWVPDATIAAMRGIMPSKSLIIHEWRKHGTCSGLSQKAYFATVRRLFAGLRIPERYHAPASPLTVAPARLARDFIRANAGLDASMISVQCGNARDEARLAGLRVCFTRQGAFRRCGANERRGCRARLLVLPPIR